MTEKDRVPPTLLTDLYQLTMAYGYWKEQMLDHEAIFHLSFRQRPFNGGYAITCGLSDAIDYLRNFEFRSDDLAYLAVLRDRMTLRFSKQSFSTISRRPICLRY